MLRRRTDVRDEGAILVIVLLFVIIASIVVTAVVEQVRASVGNTLIVRDKQTKVYAADSGIDVAIQTLRRDTTICPDPANPSDLPPITINGRTVTVRCTTISGSSYGGLGFAVVALDRTAPSLLTQSGGGGLKQIDGPVYAGRLDDGVDLTVADGDVLEYKSGSSCASSADKPGNLTIKGTPAYSYRCVTDAERPAPDPKPSLPTSRPATAPAPLVVPGVCTTFFPGTYTAANAPVLADRNYFVSGLYYFENVTLDFTSAVGVGGRPTGTEGGSALIPAGVNGNAACSSDSAIPLPPTPAPTVTGTGVKWVFGGTARLHVGNTPGSELELYSRDGGATQEGDQGISLMSVYKASTGLVQSSLGLADALVGVDTGDNPELTFHGLLYVPNALVDYNATNSSNAQIRGGVVAGRVMLQASASATGLTVRIDQKPGRRRVVLKSVASGANNGGKNITSEAVVEFANDAARTFSIETWRTTN